MERGAGVLLHPTSLPGETGREILGSAIRFLDFLQAAGQKIWQILPLNPPGLGILPISPFRLLPDRKNCWPELFPCPGG